MKHSVSRMKKLERAPRPEPLFVSVWDGIPDASDPDENLHMDAQKGPFSPRLAFTPSFVVLRGR